MRPRIILDSGAFSAWTRGVTIEVEDFADFVHKHGPWEAVVNLDVIGDPVGSFENWLKLRELGCETLPVFHLDEPHEWLEAYLAEGADYVCLGNLKGGKGLSRKRRWLESIFPLLDGVKVHGLGVFEASLLKAFPFFSVDSSTWSMAAGFQGSFYLPSLGKTYDYSNRVVMHWGRISGPKHVLHLSDTVRSYIEDYLSQFSLSLQDMEGWYARKVVNAAFFLGAQDQLGVRFYFVHTVAKDEPEILTDFGVDYRLLSYWYLRILDVQHYKETGLSRRPNGKDPS